MLDFIQTSTSPSASSSLLADRRTQTRRPLPREQSDALLRWLAQTLDQVGRGMVLLTDGGKVLHANRLARLSLAGEAAVVLHEGELRTRNAKDTPRLQEALEAGEYRGLRRMLSFGEGAQRLTVAVLPLAPVGGRSALLVSLPRPQRSEDLSLQCYARSHGLTAAETGVLEALFEGDKPLDIARRKGVQLSTVRTQISCIRHKTATRSIRELLGTVAALPPMMPVLHGSSLSALASEAPMLMI
jgi:DNA-binding CsgD family transcriptional regulator